MTMSGCTMAVTPFKKKVVPIIIATLVGILLFELYVTTETPVIKLAVVTDNLTKALPAATTVESSGWQESLCFNKNRNPASPFPLLPFEPEESGRNIFFVESSCASSIRGRMACAVESAARHHKNHVVHLLVTTPYLNGASGFIQALASLPNVRLSAADVDDIFKGTLLQEWNQRLTWALNTDWPLINLSNALRLAVVYKYGGIYLDTDMLILAPLSFKGPWLGLETKDTPNNAAFQYPRGHWLGKDAISNFVEHFTGRVWAHNGPQMFRRVIEGHCGKIINMTNCRDVQLLEPAVLYPLYYPYWNSFFESGKGRRWMRERPEATVAIHLWNSMSHKRSIEFGDGSIVEMVAKENCPLVYAAAQEEF